MKLSRISAAAGVLACAVAASVLLPLVPAFANDPIAAVIADPGLNPFGKLPVSALAPAAPTSVDLTGLITAAGSIVVSLVSVVAYFFLQKFIKDDSARKVILGAVENAAKWGVAKTAGALPGSVLSVNVGSAVAAAGLQHVVDTVPDALARHGNDYAGIVRIILGKLSIDGAIDDATVNQIVATATGKSVGNAAPAAPADISAQLLGAAPALAEAVVAALANRNKPAAPAPAA